MSYVGVDYRMSLPTNFVSIFAFNYLMEKHATSVVHRCWFNSPHIHVKIRGYSFKCYENNV
jgi:hypothetical protein